MYLHAAARGSPFSIFHEEVGDLTRVTLSCYLVLQVRQDDLILQWTGNTPDSLLFFQPGKKVPIQISDIILITVVSCI